MTATSNGDRAAGVLRATARAALLLAFAASTARAQDQPAPPSVTRRVPAAIVTEVAPADLPDDPTAFTSVIRVDDYRAEVTDVPELLSRVPGVQIRRFGGEGQPAEISIRGSTAAQVVVLLDGVRLNSAQSGAVDLSTVPLGLLERIEVSRGGGSVQAGSDAIGGVVHLITRRPGGQRRSDASFSAGSWDTFHGSLATSGTARTLEYALGYDGFGTDGDFRFQRPVLEVGDVRIEPDPASAERINDAVEQHAGLVTIGRELSERLHWTLRDQLVYASRGQPGLDAGSVGDAGQRPNAHERRTRNVLGTTLAASALGPLALDGALDFWHRYERTRFHDPDVVPSLGRTIESDDRNDEFGSRLQVERELAFGPTRHRPSLAVELRRDALRSNEFDDEGRNAAGVVVQEDARLFGDWLRLVPALRWDRTEGFDGEWLPRIGAIVEPVRWLHIKGNAERSFRVPNFDELYFPDRGFLRGNPALQPEDARNFDAGLEIGAETLGPLDDVYFEGAWFYNDVRDSIVFLLVSPSLVEPRNTGEATIRGFELGAGFGVLDWLGVSANYTHLDADVDASDAPLAGRADDEVSVRVELGPPSRLVRLIGEMQYTSEIPVSDTGNTILPSRTVFDAAVSVDFARIAFVASHVPVDSLLVTLEGKNLTDRAVRDAQFFPQPGRSLMLKVATSW